MFWTSAIRDIIDVLIVAYVFYRLILLIKGTRAVELLKGLVLLFITALLSDWLGFTTISWILRNSMTFLVVALPIVFQPELRRALEHLGRGRFFNPVAVDREKTSREIASAAFRLSEKGWGGIIVIERETGLKDFIEEGTILDSVISTQLLIGIFSPKNPLHDGAVIISDGRIKAASCVLPLAETSKLKGSPGTRHRAGIGITEHSDALALVISEETGTVSLIDSGRMRRFFDQDSLQEKLQREMKRVFDEKNIFRQWRVNV